MRSKVSNILKVVGRDAPDMIGKAIYHAADGVHDGGRIGADKRHKYRMALHKVRMRASGMTDDVFGAKEVAGAHQNRYENEFPEPKS